MMLNSAYKVKKLGSFQEMAYHISNGNRGYIFLISAMKVAYLCMTSSYCLSFIASYFTAFITMFYTVTAE